MSAESRKMLFGLFAFDKLLQLEHALVGDTVPVDVGRVTVAEHDGSHVVADGFGTDTDTVILLGKDGGKNIIGPASKQIVAKKLIEIVTTPKGNI